MLTRDIEIYKNTELLHSNKYPLFSTRIYVCKTETSLCKLFTSHFTRFFKTFYSIELRWQYNHKKFSIVVWQNFLRNIFGFGLKGAWSTAFPRTQTHTHIYSHTVAATNYNYFLNVSWVYFKCQVDWDKFSFFYQEINMKIILK